MKQANLCQLFTGHHEVLTVREIAQTIRCSESHIRRMVHKDELPCFAVGRQYRVLKSDVLACLSKG